MTSRPAVRVPCKRVGSVEVPLPAYQSAGAAGLDLCAAIREGTAPKVTVEEGLWSVAVGAAAHRSIDEGRPVALSELLPAT